MMMMMAMAIRSFVPFFEWSMAKSVTAAAACCCCCCSQYAGR